MKERSDNIIKKGNRYSWVIELPMLKNLFLLFEVWKVLGITYVLMLFVTLLINLFSGGGMDGMVSASKASTIVLAILLVLSLPAYYLVTRANNGKYTVLFEMDERGIDHTQIKTDKARAMEVLTMLAGEASGNKTTKGAGILSAAGGSLYSPFVSIREIRTDPEKKLIRLQSLLISNQVYTEAEDYDFVLNYIVDHCPKARVN
ncbi:MAG: hypothetical protein IKH68_06250 [Erysipelotrichaceae bacterium]|nr:hypothetical protein [Erysipelotrichaceae bacterium]